mmetsp:Transcript_17372/g.57518  ORF Transcript_17372/g.57518 Transcript_17372/m.57518 type:complete len:99 (-) Transcript_17372:67-363(-)
MARKGQGHRRQMDDDRGKVNKDRLTGKLHRRQAGKGHGLSAKTGQVDGYTETVNPGPEETRPHRRLGTEDYGNNRNSETTIEPWMPQRAIQEGPLCQA